MMNKCVNCIHQAYEENITSFPSTKDLHRDNVRPIHFQTLSNYHHLLSLWSVLSVRVLRISYTVLTVGRDSIEIVSLYQSMALTPEKAWSN
jgi:hypothetical protein